MGKYTRLECKRRRGGDDRRKRRMMSERSGVSAIRSARPVRSVAKDTLTFASVEPANRENSHRSILPLKLPSQEDRVEARPRETAAKVHRMKGQVAVQTVDEVLGVPCV